MNTRQAEKAMNEILRDFNLQDIAKYELVKEAWDSGDCCLYGYWKKNQ